MEYFWTLLGYDDEKTDIPEEELEELRMISTFERKEIIRLRREFLRFTNGSEFLSRKNFCLIPCIAVNPLQDRICLCFGYLEIENDEIETERIYMGDGKFEGESSKTNITKKAVEELSLDDNNLKIDGDQKRLSVTSVNTADGKKTARLSISSNISRLEIPQTPTNVPPEKNGLESPSSTAISPLIPTEDRELLENVIDIEAPPEIKSKIESELTRLVLITKRYDQDNSKMIDFRTFLKNLSDFNCFGKIEVKLKLAFRIQDFDNDDIISRTDMTEYLKRVTGGRGQEEDIGDLVDELFNECCLDPRKQKITYEDFQRVVATSDFHTKLRLPI